MFNYLFLFERDGTILEIVNILVPNIVISIRVILRGKMGWECGRLLVFPQRQNCIVDVNQSVGIAGNVASLHPHDVVLCVDAPDFQAPQIAPSIAHVAGHFCSGPYASFCAPCTNITRPAMSFSHTVRRRHSLEAVPFHNALKAMVNAVKLDVII